MNVALVAAYIPCPFGRSTVLAMTYAPPMRAARIAPPNLRKPRETIDAGLLLALMEAPHG